MMPGSEQDADLGMVGTTPTSQIEPAFARQTHIREQDVDWHRASKDPLRLGRVRCFESAEAAILQVFRDNDANQRFILHNEERSRGPVFYSIRCYQNYASVAFAFYMRRRRVILGPE
jgi:hypothetical protein